MCIFYEQTHLNGTRITSALFIVAAGTRHLLCNWENIFGKNLRTCDYLEIFKHLCTICSALSHTQLSQYAENYRAYSFEFIINLTAL